MSAAPIAEQLYPEILRFCRRKYPEIGEDLAHDAWLILFETEREGRLRQPEAAWGFLQTVMRRLFLQWRLRSRRKEALHEASAVTDPR